MAFTPDYMTGFEVGTINIVPDSQRSPDVDGDVIATVSPVHTGNYALSVRGSTGYILFPVAGVPTSLYIGMWLQITGSTPGAPHILVQLTDGATAGLRFDGVRFDAYRSGTKLLDGNISIDENIWYRLSLFINVGNAGGEITWYIDGILDNTFAGDTQFGAVNAIEFVRIAFPDGNNTFLVTVDDMVYGSGGYPPDLRADVLTPTGDTATEEWTRSVGADSYALVDDVPPSDVDYIETNVDNETTLVSMSDWDDTNKTPVYVQLWARAKKDEAAAHQIKLITDDGAATEVSAGLDMQTDYEYIYHRFDNAPDAGAWANVDVDALNIGVRSVIV